MPRSPISAISRRRFESAMALVTKDGKVRIHAAGSPQMMVNAKRLTWVDEVRPQRDAAKHIAEWAEEAAGQGPLGFWTTEAMPADLQPRFEAGANGRKLIDVSATLNRAAAREIAGRVASCRARQRRPRQICRGDEGTRQRRERPRSGDRRRTSAAADAGASGFAHADRASARAARRPRSIIRKAASSIRSSLISPCAMPATGPRAALTLSSIDERDGEAQRGRAASDARQKRHAGATVADARAMRRDELGGLAIHPAAQQGRRSVSV